MIKYFVVKSSSRDQILIEVQILPPKKSIASVELRKIQICVGGWGLSKNHSLRYFWSLPLLFNFLWARDWWEGLVGLLTRVLTTDFPHKHSAVLVIQSSKCILCDAMACNGYFSKNLSKAIEQSEVLTNILQLECSCLFHWDVVPNSSQSTYSICQDLRESGKIWHLYLMVGSWQSQWGLRMEDKCQYWKWTPLDVDSRAIGLIVAWISIIPAHCLVAPYLVGTLRVRGSPWQHKY